MLSSDHALGALAIAALALGWLAVQRAWHRTFIDACDDPDALAGRVECTSHDCRTTCVRHPGADLEPEEPR
ncbi:MAG: hypothetical protein ACYTG2_17060 [Planctomycetota bacterium]|jgi:hypothetical protein